MRFFRWSSRRFYSSSLFVEKSVLRIIVIIIGRGKGGRPRDEPVLREAFEEEKEISSDIEYHTYSIVNSYPHDTNAFTQGFLYHSASEEFFESTGSVPHGKLSDVRRADIEAGEVLELKTIPNRRLEKGWFYERGDEKGEEE